MNQLELRPTWTSALAPGAPSQGPAPAVASPEAPKPAARSRSASGVLPSSVSDRKRIRHEAYVRAALEGESRAVRNAAEGSRNDTLNISACKLGGLVASGALANEEAVAELTSAALEAGLGAREIENTIASGLRAGAESPRDIPSPSAISGIGAPANPGLTDPVPPNEERRAASISDVVDEWRQGPLVHEPTGIPQLDDFTGGGPVYGTRWYLGGSPDAGKTALLLQIAHVYAARGIVVGLLAVDEEAGDLVTRLAQRIGYSRTHCEVRDPGVLTAIEAELGALPLRLYDAAWTIEAAAADLAALAIGRAQQDPASHPHGPRAMLGVDSIQTVSCAADFRAAISGRELSEVSAVTARVRALRAVATRHRMVAIATTELGRGAYRSSDPSQQTSILAAGKWSGAIEYSARVLLGLRSVAGEQDLVEVEIAKNKHGPRDEKVYLRIDRRSQTLTPVAYDAPPPASSADRDEAARDKVTADAVIVARVLLAKPGLTVREFRAAVKAASGIGHDRVDTALDLLADSVIRGRGANRSTPLSLDIERLPGLIRRAVEASNDRCA